MARPRKKPEGVSGGQALYIVDRLIRDRHVSVAELHRYLGDMHQEIRDLEERIAKMRSIAGTPAPTAVKRRPGRPPGSRNKNAVTVTENAAAAKPASGTEGDGKKRRRRRTAVTPAQMAARKIQGSYLGFIRQIPAGKRGRYQKIAKREGREAAIQALKAVLNK